VGGRVDTNSVLLTKLLADQGIEVRFKTVVGDDVNDICKVLTHASKRVSLVVVTGGLGPTVDDLTREAVAKVIGQPLYLHPEVYRSLKVKLAQSGRSVTSNQRRQAYLPAGAELLENPSGTAPGFSVKWEGSRIFCLPGVSHEAQKMFSESVLSLLAKERLGGQGIESRAIHTFGLIEGVIDKKISGMVPSKSGIRLGILASPLGISISLTDSHHDGSCGGRKIKANRRKIGVKLEFYLKKISSRLGSHVFGFDNQTMEQKIGEILTDQGWTLALAESCTGGLIGHRLTQIPGSSRYVDRGVICYSNQAKMELLGVPKSLLSKHGAVSAHVAKVMAKGIRERSNVDLGLSITGIAGPGGGSLKKPVGLVYVGLATPRKVYTQEYRFHGDRPTIKLRSSQAALDMLRRWGTGQPLSER